jgi:hydroxyacyl-ACP dehydratase HTD2-like protein with hotdog domain
VNDVTTKAIGITDIVRYAGASGDFNPLHHDPEYARAAGYEGPFAMGMLTAGILGTWAVEQFGASRIRRFRVRFDQVVYPGDALSISAGAPVDVAGPDQEPCSEVTVVCRTERAGVVMRAWVTVTR